MASTPDRSTSPGGSTSPGRSTSRPAPTGLDLSHFYRHINHSKLTVPLLAWEEPVVDWESHDEISKCLTVIHIIGTFSIAGRFPDYYVHDCRNLCNKWKNFVKENHILTKVFYDASGAYTVAKINGNNIMWITPNEHKVIIDDGGLGWLLIVCSYYVFMLKNWFKKILPEKDEDFEKRRTLFAGKTFFLDNLVPTVFLTFVIESFGGEVTLRPSPDVYMISDVTDSVITGGPPWKYYHYHFIIDSVNSLILQEIRNYAMYRPYSIVLPFEEVEGFVPDFLKKILVQEKLKKRKEKKEKKEENKKGRKKMLEGEVEKLEKCKKKLKRAGYGSESEAYDEAAIKLENCRKKLKRAGYGSESEADDEAAIVSLPSDLGRVNKASTKSAVKLQEIRPRMTLDLIKIEEGSCSGGVIFSSSASGDKKSEEKNTGSDGEEEFDDEEDMDEEKEGDEQEGEQEGDEGEE